MACEVPVIAGDIPSLRERCADAALFCDPGNIHDIAEKMLTIINDEKARKRLIASGREHSLMYNWSRCVEESLRLMMSLKQ